MNSGLGIQRAFIIQELLRHFTDMKPDIVTSHKKLWAQCIISKRDFWIDATDNNITVEQC